jgi:iron complex transport system substrate-binding protein
MGYIGGRLMRLIKSRALLLLIALLIAGCVKSQVEVKTTPEQQSITVVDARGKEVEIQTPVKKVISIYGMAPPFIYLLGEGDKFYAGWMWGTDFYKLIDPKIEEKTSKERSLNVEDIKKEDPDVVLASTWKKFARDINQLESLGVPVVCINIESIDDIYATIRILGKIFQKEDYADKIIEYYEGCVKDVEKRISGVEEKPKVLVVYYSGKAKAYRTFGGDMFQSKLIEMAGGISVSKELSGKQTINVEQVANWNPDIILIIQYWKSGKDLKEEILNDPAWKRIKAVKDGKVYVVPNDGENWIDPCPKWILGLYWTAKVLHPEEFKDLNVKAKADEFYKKFFGLSVDEVKIAGDLI